LNVEKALIDNFVSLQKVLTTMAVKFDSLSTQISKLLELFEISAKSLAEKGYSLEDKKVADKMDNLLEQNKIIAKGVALLYEKEKPQEEMPQREIRMPPTQSIQRAMPQRFSMPTEEKKDLRKIGV
jgi:hypothetical protein